MGNKYQISDSEWLIMKIIWMNETATANEIIEALDSEKDWAPKTIKTMLNRLVSKKILGYIKEGRAYKYYPLVSSEETIESETKSFLDKVFDGKFSGLVANFVESNDFDDEEIEELKKILERKNP